jgi:hypothetical protein
MADIRIERVLVQKRDGEFASEEDYAVWLAFMVRGVPVQTYTRDDMLAGRCELRRDTLVVGSVRCVHAALQQLGVSIPKACDLPESLASYRGRRIWTSDWGTIHREFLAGRTEPIFVKPLDDVKAFVGYVLRTRADLEPTMSCPAHMKLLVSEVVEFVSEWRSYVLRGEVIGVGHYKGDPLRFPDPEVIRSAVKDFQAESPVAYGLDFGITAAGRSLLIEVNDGYAIGSYGLPAPKLAEMYEARWLELVGV